MHNALALKILIADDEKGITFFFKDYFSRKDFVVFEANDCMSAIETFRKEKPQVCFIDIWMDRGTHGGVEVLRKIKEIDKNAYCIMMGPCLDEENTVKQTKELGASYFINRRLDPEDIDQCIEDIRKRIFERNSSIRDLFHNLGNKLHLITLGTGAIKESVKECLDEENDISEGAKEKLSDILKNLDGIIKDIKEADRKTREIEEQVYKAIDPDTGKPKES